MIENLICINPSAKLNLEQGLQYEVILSEGPNKYDKNSLCTVIIGGQKIQARYWHFKPFRTN